MIEKVVVVNSFLKDLSNRASIFNIGFPNLDIKYLSHSNVILEIMSDLIIFDIFLNLFDHTLYLRRQKKQILVFEKRDLS